MFPIMRAGPAIESASLPAFVVARDGLYLRKRSLLGLSQTKVRRVAHLPDGHARSSPAPTHREGSRVSSRLAMWKTAALEGSAKLLSALGHLLRSSGRS